MRDENFINDLISSISRSFYSANGTVVWLFNLNIAFQLLAYV